MSSPSPLCLLIVSSLLLSTGAFWSSSINGRSRQQQTRCHLKVKVASDNEFTALEESNARRKLISRSFGTTFATFCAYQPSNVNAISADEASKSYDTYAATYDELDGGAAASALGIDAARSAMLSQARGRVLEIGVGTGLNVGKYNFGTNGVNSLTFVDISDGMLNEAKSKVAALGIPANVKVDFVRADATTELVDLFGRDTFDTVVDTFSLCVMGNQGAKDCLQQMCDIVKTGNDNGQILLIENTRSSNPLLGLYQDATADTASQVGGKGCVYNQDVTAFIRNTAGLTIEKEEPFAGGLFRSYVCRKKL